MLICFVHIDFDCDLGCTIFAHVKERNNWFQQLVFCKLKNRQNFFGNAKRHFWESLHCQNFLAIWQLFLKWSYPCGLGNYLAENYSRHPTRVEIKPSVLPILLNINIFVGWSSQVLMYSYYSQVLAASTDESSCCIWITVPIGCMPSLMTPLRDKQKQVIPVAVPQGHAQLEDKGLLAPYTLPPNTDTYNPSSASLKSLDTVVRQLQELLPEPIQYDRQDKVDTDTLLLTMTAEAASFNDTIGLIQSCLDCCVSYIQGKLVLNASICQLLSLFMCDSVPPEWANKLGLMSSHVPNLSLITLLQLLQRRRLFLAKCLDEGSVPYIVDPCMLSRPSAVPALLQQRQRNTEHQVVAAQV